MKASSKRNMLFGFLLVAFIIAFEIIFVRLKLPAWPAFMVMIFFFVVHEDTSMSPHILIGGLTGIACLMLSKKVIPMVKLFTGLEAARLIFIGLFVYAIVLFKDTVPYVFNSFAFMFFLVSAVISHHSNVDPLVWIGVELIVGGVFIVGILGINRITVFLLK